MRGKESDLLIRLFRAALAAVDPANCLPSHLPTRRPPGRTFVLGAGKAAASMAAAVAAHHRDHDLGPIGGVVVTRYGHGLRPGEQAPGIDILEAGHPVPDDASLAAGKRILEVARSIRPEDRCIVLLSGGASSLLVQPVAGLALADKQAMTSQLLASGATIAEINAVRRRLSLVKGGGLARAIRADEILLLAISDVAGDVLADIGSGPLHPDPSTGAEVREILERHAIAVPPRVAQALEGRTGSVGPVPPVVAQVVANSAIAVAAAARTAEAEGWATLVLPEAYGTARDTAAAHACLVRDLRRRSQRTVLLSGGETTVHVTQPGGKGGRNGEYLLSLALGLGIESGCHAFAADTDGLDGSGDNAGAIITPDTLRRAARAGHDGAAQLAAQRSYHFFAALGDLVTTGPTRTNVNDLRLILV